MAQYIWPVPKSIGVNQPFGSSPGGVNPAGGHTGMDFGTPMGTPIYAPAAGVIEYAQWFTTDDGSDNPYWITSGGGISVVLGCDGDASPSFVFSHLSSTGRNRGERVRQGDVIGYSGNTGKWTTGPHLHFEAIPPGFNLRSNTYGRVNPAVYCTAYKQAVTPQSGTITPIKEAALSAAEVNQIIKAISDARLDVKAAVAAVPGQTWATPVSRLIDGKSVKINALQELADIKTSALGLEPVVASIAAQTDPKAIADLIPADIAAQVITALSAKLSDGVK